MKYFVGCSGWKYDHWKGDFYPDEVAKKRWLNYYSQQFNTVEVNATFYGSMKEKTFKKWYDNTEKNFVFTLKGSRWVTHRKKPEEAGDSVEKFYDRSKALNDKLGCILWQLKPSFKKDLKRLEAFCDLLNPSFKNVIEFRDESWFVNEIYEMLEKKRIGFCSISTPDLPDPILSTTDFAYIRFHGSKEWYRSEYETEELKNYASKIKALDAEEIYCYFNNDTEGHAPHDAQKLKEILEEN
ncbi:MAG: DUF72 domain-containing protein [Kosmotogaceae bacterium]